MLVKLNFLELAKKGTNKGISIDKRYSGMKPVIITSTLPLSALEKTYDGRIISRLYEMCVQYKFTKQTFNKRSKIIQTE